MDKIKIIIDGKEITGKSGESILNIAAENGIEIPNLCHSKELENFGACGLCLVEAEGFSRLLRACSARAEDGMKIHTDSPRVKKARNAALELIMSDHEGDCIGPCSKNCPAHTDVQGYLKRIAEGKYSEAVKIIKEKIPIPASVGRICPHPCETECRRRFAEEPLSIAYLKAFAADMDLKSENPFKEELLEETGKSIAIIGGGPAGLSAAYRLRLMGHSVTIFDIMPEMGGMLRYGIPEYRLPKAVLKKETDAIKNLGVSFKNNVKIGKDLALKELQKEFDAMLVALGAWQDGNIYCKGENLCGVFGGTEFLRGVNCGKNPDIGKKVAVIGGGNTAMDACRTALRCGAEKVYVIYRRTREEAPAADAEITEAIEEGVEFKFLAAPEEIIGVNGKVKAIKLQIMELAEADSSGRRKPVPIEGRFETIEVDSVIKAVGQKCDLAGFEELELTEKGTVAAKAKTGETNLKGVFAAGDITNRGPSIAIEAIAEGNTAAKAINAYLCGAPFDFGENVYSERKVSAKDYEHISKIPRIKMPLKTAEERKNTFDEVICGFTEEQAKAEAKRCLECGCHDYADCKLIRYARENRIDMRKFAGVKHNSFTERKLLLIERDQGKCMLCGLCVRVCEEKIGKGLLGFRGRGFKTAILPEFEHGEEIADCANCLECAKICPTGALKIIK